VKLRTRIALLVGIVVAVTVVAISAATLIGARREVLRAVDDRLRERADIIDSFPGSPPGRSRSSLFGPIGRLEVEIQVIDVQGQIVDSTTSAILPIGQNDLEVAQRLRRANWSTVDVEAVRTRIYTVPAGRAWAIMLASDLTQAEQGVRGLTAVIAIVAIVGVGAAALLGWLGARRVMGPVERLNAAAAEVSRTQRLDQKIPVDRSDELGELAGNFNSMLEALEASREQQHRLVTDASHELRTPLTSLRTNVELMQRARDLPEDEQLQIMDDVVFELGELTSLAAELVELATDRHETGDELVVDLAEVVATVVDRHRRRTGVEIDMQLAPSMVKGVPILLERAVSNLLENAIKFSSAGGRIEVRSSDGGVRVRDWGPGIAPEEAEAVFERFYRTDEARSEPGSGLGLSIVRHITESFGGAAWVEAPPPDPDGESSTAPGSGGTVAVLEFPVVS
jgi:two-component system sensor histidine kinase MprB